MIALLEQITDCVLKGVGAVKGAFESIFKLAGAAKKQQTWLMMA